MKNQSLKEPKQRRAFLDNYRAAILAVMALLITICSTAQDSAKYSPINGYGFRYKRMGFDSVLMVPLSNSPHTPYRMGALRYRASDSTLQLWTGHQWNSILTGIGNGVDTAYALNDSTLAIETPDQNFFVKIIGKPSATQLTDSSFKVGNDTIIVKGTAQGLQQVTKKSNKSTDSIVAGGLITKHILSDTTNEPDFEIPIFPDIQIETMFYQPVLDSMFNYVVNNRVSHNIPAMFQVGDITNGTHPSLYYWQWDTAVVRFNRIKATGMPHMMVIGNHDYDDDDPAPRGATAFNTYFGPAYFTGQTYYGNNFHGSNENYYIKFNVGSHKYLGLGLEFLPRDSVLDWAGRVVDSFPDREVFVVTHAYITHWNERSVDTSDFSNYGLPNLNTGQQIWDKFVKKHKNIIMVLSGHYIIVGSLLPTVGNIKDVGDSGNVVHNFVVNYQKDTLGGNGYMMRMKFSPRNATVTVDFYSPYLNQTDWREPSYVFNYPNTSVNTTEGVGGDLITHHLRVKGELKAEKLRAHAIPYVGQDHELLTDNRFLFIDSNKITTLKLKKGIKLDSEDSIHANKLKADTLIGTVNNFDSVYVRKIYVKSLLFGGTTSADTLNIAPNSSANNGYVKFGTSLTGGASYYDATDNAFLVGTTSYFAELTIMKSRPGNLGIFIKNLDGTFDGANERVALRNDVNETSQFVQYNSVSTGFGNGARSVLISAGALNGLKIATTSGGPIVFGNNTAAGAGEQMKFFPGSGNFVINSSTDNGDRLNVVGTARIGDTLKLPNAASTADTTKKPIVRDASGNTFVMPSWPNTSPIQPLQNFTSGNANTGTTETDLFSYTIPANTLVNDGDKITFDVTGQFFDPTATITNIFYFAGTSIYNSTAMTISSTGSWNAKVIVIRTGSTTAKASVVFNAINASGFPSMKYTPLTSLDFTTTNIIKVTGTSGGTGGGSGDVSADMGYILYVK